MNFCFVSLVLIIFVSIYCGIVCSARVGTIVKTQSGAVQGYNSTTHLIFKGIPYGTANRWQLPTPPKNWDYLLNATNFGPACSQTSTSSNFTNQSEDCLYLNVYTPNFADTDTPFAVIVWIHGGSFLHGDSSQYNSEFLSGNNTVVVTINYRLGPFGFLAHPALLKSSSVNTTGFYGIQDQRLALTWVKENIGNFGGDPNRVNIAGESAGAMSVCVHQVCPRSKGLFNTLTMESGNCRIFDTQDGMAVGQNFVNNVGCNVLDPVSCLASKSTSQLLAGVNVTYWPPTLNAYEIVQQPNVLIENFEFNFAPLLAGTNLNEASFFICSEYSGINKTGYINYLNQQFGEGLALLISEVYPVSNYPTPVAALIDVLSDYEFKCPTKNVVSTITSSHLASTYLYSFEHVSSWLPNNNCLGVSHTYELPYLFPSGYNMSNSEITLSLQMRQAWTNFAATGISTLLEPYDIFNQSYTILNTPLSKGDNFRQFYCDFWYNL